VDEDNGESECYVTAAFLQVLSSVLQFAKWLFCFIYTNHRCLSGSNVSEHWKKYEASGLASIILHPLLNLSCFHSVWHCWLGIRVWPIKIEWWGWLKWGADCLHMGCHCQPQTLSSLASLKSRMVLPFRYRLTQVVLEKRSFCLLDPWGKGCCFFMPAIYATVSVKSVVC